MTITAETILDPIESVYEPGPETLLNVIEPIMLLPHQAIIKVIAFLQCVTNHIEAHNDLHDFMGQSYESLVPDVGAKFYVRNSDGTLRECTLEQLVERSNLGVDKSDDTV